MVKPSVFSSKDHKLLQNGFGLYSSGSRAKIDTVCALVLIVFRTQVFQLSMPVSKRSTLNDLWLSVRQEYGGNDKDRDRAKYDTCNLARHLYGKLTRDNYAIIARFGKMDFAEAHSELSEKVVAELRHATINDLRVWLGLSSNIRGMSGDRILQIVSDSLVRLTENELKVILRKVDRELKSRSHGVAK
jgi:hypothetical protein